MVDLTLEGSHGMDLLKDLRKQHPALAALVFSMHDECLYAERALRAGAQGYVVNTVQAHCEHIKTKLELPDFTSLAHFAMHWIEAGHPGRSSTDTVSV